MLPHFGQSIAISHMKFGKILLKIPSGESPLVPDVEKYTPISIGKRPVRQGPNLANVVNDDTFDPFQRPIEIIMGKVIYEVSRRKTLWQCRIHQRA
jgi:hypothetical protein